MSSLPNYSPTFLKIMPVCGFCCVMCSLETIYPECFGCHCNQNCLCCYGEEICIKCSKEPFYTCICLRNNCATGPCDSCIKSNCQCFCIDLRFALPPRSATINPCITTICGITVFFSWQTVCECCVPVEKLYAAVRQPVPTRNEVQLPPVNHNLAPSTQPATARASKDIDYIVNRAINDQSTYSMGAAESTTDDAFYAIESADTSNNAL